MQVRTGLDASTAYTYRNIAVIARIVPMFSKWVNKQEKEFRVTYTLGVRMVIIKTSSYCLRSVGLIL